MKRIKEKDVWNFAAMFIIVLIISMPFYSANALAAVSVQITKNQGEDNIWGYLDAESDVWTVEALFNGVQGNGSVDPKDVKVKIGQHEAEFQTCSDGPLGVACEYISPLTDGIKEAEHVFQVIYYQKDELGYDVVPSPSDGDVIKADGSAPKISGISIGQDDNAEVDINFIVEDKVNLEAPAVGIKLIEIIDADSGTTLQTIGEFELGEKTNFHYANDAGFGGKLQAQLEGEGLKSFKIRAVDHLGHEKISPAFFLDGDFVSPEIGSELDFIQFGEFMGEYADESSIMVDITETNNLIDVRASSDQAFLDNVAADCDADDEIDDLWHCYWDNVRIYPESSVTLSITAKDEYGNLAEKSISKEFTKDSSAPQVAFFGSDRTFAGESYIKDGEQIIILEVKETGAGIDTTGVRANLAALDLSVSEVPMNCTTTAIGYGCYWLTEKSFSTGGVAQISMETLEDGVGNEAELPTIDLIVDNTGPNVEKLSVYGYAGAEDKPYFSSNDQLRIKLTAAEVSGLVVMVNLNDIVMDAETKFPENKYSYGLGDGWQVFTEENCVRDELQLWECVFDTEAVKSGPDNSVRLEIKVQDTAGNDAVEWPETNLVKNAKTFSARNDYATFTFDLLGLSTELNPDYWEVSTGFPRPLIDFIDLDIVELTQTRLPFTVKFKTTNPQTRILAIDLPPGACVPADTGYAPIPTTATNPDALQTPVSEPEPQPDPVATGQAIFGLATEDAPQTDPQGYPPVSRNLLYGKSFAGGHSSPVSTKMIVEFPPFNGKEMFNIGETEDIFEEVYAYYDCTFKIYSRVGSDAISNPEIQDVRVAVPFAFTELGSKDENIDELIKNIKDDIWFQIPDKIKWLNKIIQWVRYLSSAINLLATIAQVIGGFVEGDKSWRNSLPVYTGPLATAMCGGIEGGVKSKGVYKVIGIIQKVAQVFSCNPSVSPNNWYEKWQRSIINIFNAWKSAGTRQTFSLYDNIWVSLFGLCIPGILHNLEKLRQVKCVHINCLKNLVPNGATTVAGCQQVNDILECKFWWGELIGALTPLTGLTSAIKDFIKNILTNPLGLVRSAITVGCAIAFCNSDGQATEFCDYAGVFVLLIDIVDNVMGLIDQYPSLSQDYCSQVGEGGWS